MDHGPVALANKSPGDSILFNPCSHAHGPQPQERRRPGKLAESHCLPSPTVQTYWWQQQEEVELEIHFSDTLMDLYITRYKWGHSAEYRQRVNGSVCVDSWLVHQIHRYPDPGPLGAPVMLQKNVPATGSESSSDTLSPSVCDPSVLNESRRGWDSSALTVSMARGVLGGAGRGLDRSGPSMAITEDKIQTGPRQMLWGRQFSS